MFLSFYLFFCSFIVPNQVSTRSRLAVGTTYQSLFQSIFIFSILILYYFSQLGESIAIALAFVGAEPVKEGTGRVVRFELIPLEDLGRPRIDVLASLSGIFRVSLIFCLGRWKLGNETN